MSPEAPSPETEQETLSGFEPPPTPAAAQTAPAGSSQVLYRKWRPQTFAEVVGQDAVTRTLRNSVASKRLAHAYLLSGPRGTGKTSLGRLIAKAANCAAPAEGEPCNECDSCRAFLEGRAIDFIEQDAASHNSVDDIRQLRENVVLNPMSGQYKVYLLDEVHMLSGSAENALLKTLEEPPPHIIFVLATTEPHRVSSTIISRCQRFDLRRLPTPAVAERLAVICDKEGLALDEASLQEVARAASGSLRDAINGLEQIATYFGASPTLAEVREALGMSVDARSAELARLLLGGELIESLKLVAAVRDDGTDMRRFTREAVDYLRGLLLVKSGAGNTLDQTAEALAEMEATAKGAERSEIVRALKTLGKVEFRDDPLSSLPLELAVVEFVADGGEQAASAARPAPRAEERVAQAKPARTSTSSARAERETALADEPSEEVEAARTSAGSARAEVSHSVEGSSAGSGQALVERIRRSCKESDQQLAALLNQSCEVTAEEGEVLTLGFYHTFHLERVEAGRYQDRLGELFSRELGRTVRVELTHAPRRPEPGKVKSGHLVEAARELGAKPIGQQDAGTELED